MFIKKFVSVFLIITILTLCFAFDVSAKKPYFVLDGYDYSLDVPSSEAKPLSYFNDAVILGDSRAVDLVIYSDLSKSKAMPYCDIGLNVTSVFNKEFVSYDGVKVDAFTAMSHNKKKFSKVYLMFGINELGYNSTESFIKQYIKVVNRVRSINKDAVIYVHSILPVSKQKSLSSNIYTNRKIKKVNRYLLKMCQEYKLFYIDAYDEFSNNEGYLPYGAATDGIHFGSTYSQRWLVFVATHTVK